MAREDWEEVQEEVALSCHCHLPGGGGDDNDDARGEEQDTMYTDVDVLSRNRQWADREESNIDNGSNNQLVDGHVRSARGRQRRERVTFITTAMIST